jgi:hypothetical protein
MRLAGAVLSLLRFQTLPAPIPEEERTLIPFGVVILIAVVALPLVKQLIDRAM